MRETLWAFMAIAVCWLGFVSFWGFRFLGASLDGWYQSYSWLLLQGQIPYRDFYVYTTPFSILKGAFVLHFLGDNLAVWRGVGIFERMIMGWILYLWIRYYASSVAALISAITTLILFSTHCLEILNYCNTDALFYMTIAGWLACRAIHADGRARVVAWVLSGFFAALVGWTKHTMGVGAVVAIGITLLVGLWNREFRLSHLAAFGVGLLLCSVPIMCWIALEGAWPAFISAIVDGGSSKGPLNNVLLRPLYNYGANAKHLMEAALMGAAAWMLWKPRFGDGNSPAGVRLIQFGYAVSLLVGWIMVSIAAAAAAINISMAKRIVSLIYSLWCSGCAVALVAWGGLIVQRMCKSESRKQWLAGMLVVSISASYIYMYNLSAGSMNESWALWPLSGFVLAFLIDAVPRRWSLSYRFAVALIPVGLISFSIAAKFDIIYSWWGWIDHLNAQEQQCESKKLKGIILPAEQANWIDSVVRAIKANSDRNDKILVVPHLAMLYWLAERRPATYAPVSYFDVCPDYVATADSQKILNDPPKIIVWEKFPEEWDQFHERLFRGGKRSGQRDLAAAINQLIPKYRQIVPPFENVKGVPILVFVKER